jgi:Subtilisin inhibitor-like
MGRLAVAVVAVAAIAAVTALAVGVASSREASAKTSLTIAYWPEGSAGKSVKWILRCEPASGTLRRPARACAKLKAGGSKLFAPLSPKVVCTEIWGGPQVARVTGKLRTARVSASFDRTNGCQIGRWNRLVPWLLPAGGVT